MTKREQREIEAIKRLLRPIYITATMKGDGFGDDSWVWVGDIARILIGIQGTFALPEDHRCFLWWSMDEYRNIDAAASWLHACDVRAPKQ